MQDKANSKNDLLKLIGIISMIIDHIGYVFFPGITGFRIIGRIAFPIFAHQITIGYKKTSNLKSYKLRLLVFALISQIPYMLVFPTGLNIFFNLLVAIYAIEFLDKKQYLALIGILLYTHLITKAVLFGYGVYGILISLMFFYNEKNKLSTVLLFTLLTLGYCVYYSANVQFFAILALPIILINWEYRLILNKWWFYLFYPLHLTILYIINNIFVN